MRQLADARAQADSKALKKTIKEFYALLSTDKSTDELQAAHATFLIGLDQLAQHLGKAAKVEQVTQWEVESYRADAASLEQTSTETRARLSALKTRLADAQQERARRIEYDGLARVIQKLPEREKGQETITRIASDISALAAEADQYSQTWDARRNAFGEIVRSLEGMQEAIRDEKAEQERRRALDDADADEDPSAPASAAMTASNSAAGPGGALDPTAKEFVPGAGGATAGEGGEEDVEMRDEGEGEAEAGRPEEGEEQAGRGSDREEGQMTDDREEGEM
ncbi:hypothetical protein JCM8097_005383 [Rhodosporidiobolus ruineniae]